MRGIVNFRRLILLFWIFFGLDFSDRAQGASLLEFAELRDCNHSLSGFAKIGVIEQALLIEATDPREAARLFESADNFVQAIRIYKYLGADAKDDLNRAELFRKLLIEQDRYRLALHRTERYREFSENRPNGTPVRRFSEIVPGTASSFDQYGGSLPAQDIRWFSEKPEGVRRLFRDLLSRSNSKMSQTGSRVREMGAISFEMSDGTHRTFKFTSDLFDSIQERDLIAFMRERDGAFKGIDAGKISKILLIHTHPDPEVAFRLFGVQTHPALSHQDLRFADTLREMFGLYFKRKGIPLEAIALPVCENCKNVYFSRWFP